MTSTIRWRQPMGTKWVDVSALEWLATGDEDFESVPSFMCTRVNADPAQKA